MTGQLLYRFFDANGVLLYVGVTANLPLRLRAHRRRDWWLDVRSMTTEGHPDRAAVLAAERIAIETERPRHNVCLNRGRAARTRRTPRCRHGWYEPDVAGVPRCCDCGQRAGFA